MTALATAWCTPAEETAETAGSEAGAGAEETATQQGAAATAAAASADSDGKGHAETNDRGSSPLPEGSVLRMGHGAVLSVCVLEIRDKQIVLVLCSQNLPTLSVRPCQALCFPAPRLGFRKWMMLRCRSSFPSWTNGDAWPRACLLALGSRWIPHM